MGLLHIANTAFEGDLISKKAPDIIASLRQNQIFAQLQFLPFLYAGKDDLVAVTDLPEETYWLTLKKLGIEPLPMHLLSSETTPKCEKIDAWGAAQSIATWAKKHKLTYDIPPIDIVREVNSKAFSFTHAPKLPGAALLHSQDEAKRWVAAQKRAFVLKTCFGVSGRGHFFAIEENLLKEWEANRPVIGEPWVERVFDFSTQWVISQNKEIAYVGATLCENDARGTYVRNIVTEPAKEILDEHLAYARPLLNKIAALGYFGNVGFDAMVYRYDGEVRVHPIVEINARKTMGWVALRLQHLHFPDEKLSLSYLRSEATGLLPNCLIGRRPFARQLLYNQ